MSEEQPLPRINYTAWVIDSLGWPKIHLLFLTTLVVLAVMSWLHQRGRGPALAAAIVLLIPWPLYVGCLISISAVIDWLYLVAVSSSQSTSFTYSQLVSRALLALIVSASCTLPLFIAGIALLWPRDVAQENDLPKVTAND